MSSLLKAKTVESHRIGQEVGPVHDVAVTSTKDDGKLRAVHVGDFLPQAGGHVITGQDGTGATLSGRVAVDLDLHVTHQSVSRSAKEEVGGLVFDVDIVVVVVVVIARPFFIASSSKL